MKKQMSIEEVVAIANGDNPRKILESIPAGKVQDIPSEICSLLTGNGLSFQQAELLLEVAKDRLRRAKI